MSKAFKIGMEYDVQDELLALTKKLSEKYTKLLKGKRLFKDNEKTQKDLGIIQEIKCNHFTEHHDANIYIITDKQKVLTYGCNLHDHIANFGYRYEEV
jgi:hypothetical protein